MEDNLTKISYLRDLSSQSPLSLEQGTLHALCRHVISLKVSAVNNTDCTQKLPVSTLLLREQKLTDHVMKYQCPMKVALSNRDRLRISVRSLSLIHI